MKNEFKNYQRKAIGRAFKAFIKKMNCKYSEAGKYFEGRDEFEVIHEFLTYEEFFWILACDTLAPYIPAEASKNDSTYWITKRVRSGFYYPFILGIDIQHKNQTVRDALIDDKDLVWFAFAVKIHAEIEIMAGKMGSEFIRVQAKIQKDRMLDCLNSLLKNRP